MSPFERMLATVAGLLDDDATPPARLLALSQTSAAVAMPDGSVANLVTIDHAPPDELRARLVALVRRTPGVHLKLCIFGGDVQVRAWLRAAQPTLAMGRAVQVFHLDDDDTPWAGRGSRLESPFGRAMQRAAAANEPPPPPQSLAARIVRMPAIEEAELRDGREFVDRMLAHRPIAAPIMLGVLVAVFALQTWLGGSLPPVLERMGASTPAALHGEPERLLASTFLHGGVVHFLFNAYALWMLGRFLERIVGAAHFVALYVAAAGLGSLTSAMLTGADLAVGASGGICGALGAAALLAWRPEGVLHPLVVPNVRRSALVNLVLVGAVSFMPAVDAWAHAGGAVAGAAYAWLMHGRIAARMQHPERRQPGVAALAFGLSALAVGSLVVALARGRPDVLRRPIELYAFEVAPQVSIAVPYAGRPPVEDTELDQTRSLLFGDLFHDLLMMRVAVSVHELPPTALAGELRRLADSPGWIPEGAQPDGDWREVEDAPHPTLHRRWIAPDLRGHVIIQARPRVLLDVETIMFTDGPDVVHEADAEIMAGLAH